MRAVAESSGRRWWAAGMGLWGVLASVVVLVLTGAGVMALQGGEGEVRAGGGVELAEARVRSFTITTLANGDLEAKNQLEIRNKVESRTTIVEIIPEGTMVKAGDLLVRLNDEELANRIAEEELAVIEARTEYENAQTAEKIQKSENDSQMRAAESKLSLAKLAYQQWELGEVVKRKQELTLAMEKAEKNLERLTSKYTKSQELYLKGFLSKDELDRDEIAYIEAVSTLKTATLDKDVYDKYQFHKDAEQKRRDVEEATAELGRAVEENEINLKAKQANTYNRERQFTLRSEQLEELRSQLANCTITAPRDGMVVYGSSVQSDNWRWQQEGGLAVGREVGNNDLLIALPDTSEMTASVKVHESIAGRVRPGQAVSVRVEAIDRTIPGLVSSVGVLAESGGWRDPNRREYTVKVDLNPDAARSAGLKPTMRCEARIELGRVEDVLTVPVQAVFNEGAVRFVLRPGEEGRFDRVPVMIGRTSDTEAEVIAGLEAGDRVLVRDPLPGEVQAIGWDPALLAAAGYVTGENGKPALPPRGGPKAADASEDGAKAGAGDPETAAKAPSTGENAGDAADRAARRRPGKAG